jgi:hypothetical protein
VNAFLSRVADERGGVLVFVAIGLPVLLAIFAIALDVGNWFVHHRSLQNQVDAAALAGGDLFGDCFTPMGPDSAFSAMKTEAARYAGGVYNLQYGGPHGGAEGFLYNSNSYPSGAAGSDSVPSNPCTSPYTFDVKGSEQNIPLMLGALLPGSTPLAHIDAHARVELRQEQSTIGELPLAVPDVNPKTVTATFVDEATGNALTGCPNGCVFPLTNTGPVNGLNIWNGQATFPVPASGSSAGGTKIGVRIGLANAGQGCANTLGGTGFACYDNATQTIGLAVLRAYPTGVNAAQPNPPVLLGVWPSTQCSGSPFFSDYSLTGGATSCPVVIQATADFGTGGADPTPLTGSGVGATLTATVNGVTVPMSYSSGVWSSPPFSDPSALSVPQDSGPVDVSLDWAERTGKVTGKGSCSTTGGNKCTGTWSSVQRVYSGVGTNSGAIETLSLAESASNPGAPYSMPSTPSSHTVTVTVGVGGSLRLSNQVVLLRTTDASRSSAIACDGSGASIFRTDIETGCQTEYQINSADLCPDSGTAPSPADCVPLQTGDMTGPTSQGMDTRFATCPAFNWPNYNTTDPRLVQLLLTDFSYLGGHGSASVPVTGFAEFYIAGWNGKTCGSSNMAWPFSFAEKNGDIWGYFVKDVIPNGKPGPNTCDPTALTPCVPIMTR